MWVSEDGEWSFALDPGDEAAPLADADSDEMFTPEYSAWIEFGVRWLDSRPGHMAIFGP